MPPLCSNPTRTFVPFGLRKFFVNRAGWRTLTSAAAMLAAGAAIAVGQAPPAAAKASPDVIVFNNGDQLTGKFLRSASGSAVFHSDIAGDITVSWDKVKEIHSQSKFVVLKKGFEAKRNALPAHPSEGSLTVENKEITLTPAEGAPSAPIPLAQVDYVIDQPTFAEELAHKRGFFSAWTGSATGGATIVAATQNTETLNGAVALVRAIPLVGWLSPQNRTLLGFIGSYGKITQPGVPDEKSAIYHAYGERDEYFSPRVYALGQAAFDHNFAQSLDLQQIYGGGLGWTIVKQAKQTLDLKGTLQYERQTFLDATPGSNQSLIGSTFAANYMRKIGKAMIFNQQLAYLPAWNNAHAYSAAETDSLVLPVYKRLGLSVGTIDTYLNDPPETTPPTKLNSFQFTFGATYTLPAPK